MSSLKNFYWSNDYVFAKENLLAETPVEFRLDFRNRFSLFRHLRRYQRRIHADASASAVAVGETGKVTQVP